MSTYNDNSDNYLASGFGGAGGAELPGIFKLFEILRLLSYK